jgi:hypothetical protein
MRNANPAPSAPPALDATEKAAIVFAVVTVLLMAIMPASRDWMIGQFTTVGAFLGDVTVTVFRAIASIFTSIF